MARMKNFQTDGEEGSITPLISIYFIVVMIVIFIVANVASAYISRRELINLTEAALAQATHELDEMRYYYQIPTPNHFGPSNDRRVPIDCRDAAISFTKEIATSTEFSEESNGIVVLGFDCDGRTLRARVERAYHLPFSLPVLSISHFTNVVEVAVTSRYL